MKALPLVSILIICYNQEKFIVDAVQSALGQNYENLEVVVADDASTDATQDLVLDLKKIYGDKLVVHFNKKNVGITHNSNIALEKCSGDLIAFMGGDDVILPEKILRQVEWFKQDDLRVLCGHDVEWIDADSVSLGVHTSKFIPMCYGEGASAFIRNGPIFSATSVMVRRDRIPAYGFHPWLSVVSDWKMWLDVIGVTGLYGYIPGVWAQYRRHSKNVTGKLSLIIIRDIFLTAGLALWDFRGRYLQDWVVYFISRLVKKCIRR